MATVPAEPAEPEPDRPMEVRFQFVGAEASAPRLVSIQLDRTLFTEAELGTAPAAFSLSLSPPVKGALTVAGVDQLQFEFAEPLRPGTKYEVTLTRPEDAQPAGGPWRSAVTTPKFGLSHATLRALPPPGGPLVADLVFSAAVDPAAVEGALKASIGDKELRLRLEAGPEPHIVTASALRPASGDEIVFRMAGDRASWVGDRALRAPATEHRLSLKSGPSMSIQGAFLQEGADGWFVEVICNDDAAPGQQRYRYRRQWAQAFQVSSRCELDERFARAMVHADPAAELSFSSGEGGFRVFGRFPRGKLELTLDAGIRTVDGGVLQQAWQASFDVPARTPRARFAEQGRYLPRAAWRSLAVRHVNMAALPLEIRHVSPENLVFWLTGEEPMTDRTSDRVLSTPIAVRSPQDEETTSSLSLSELVHDPKPGVYELKIGEGPGSTARILRTDLHLVAKAAGPRPGSAPIPSIQVWALDVHSGSPLSGVTVRAVRSSGTSMAECTTRGASGCALELRPDSAEPRPPFALVARRGDDLTYIELDQLELGLPVDAGGEPYTASSPYRAPMWTDRGVYRPGDAAHVAAIVRSADHVAPPEGLPVVLRLFDPKGRETRKRVVETDAVGMIATDLRFGDYASTGRYRVVAEIGGQSTGEVSFQIEEFVPERLKVSARAGAAAYAAGESPSIEVSGAWLFGGSAEGAAVEVNCRLLPLSFTAEGFSGWSFGPAWLDGLPQPVTLGAVEGALGPDGTATVACPVVERVRGPSDLVADAAVFEGETGRTTVATAHTAVHPERYVLGIETGADKAPAGNTMLFQGAVLGWDGKLRTRGPSAVSVEVFRMEEEYGWYYDDDRGEGLQQRQLRPVHEEDLRVTVTDGRFRFEVTPESDSAGTLVRVTAGNAVTERFIEGTGSRYWWDDSEPGRVVDATPRPVRPTALRIATPETIGVAHATDVVITAPYAGRMLVTVETDEVLRAAWIDAVAGENRWRFSLDRFVPNVYVSALLIKDPHLESKEAFLPDRAFGVASVRVQPDAYSRALTLTVPDETKPYRPLTVELQLDGGGPAFATVAAVDEGILSLTRFSTPDPLAMLFSQRALGVTSYETVGWTRAVAAGGTSSASGGDAAEEPEPQSGQRVQMVKPVALWSGIVPLDADGHGKVTFDVPGYRGSLRVMAVAATRDAIGSASASVTVRDPLVLATTLPRFLLAGDEAHIPVMVTNMTGKAREVEILLESTELVRGAVPDATSGPPLPPPLALLGDDRRKLMIAAGETKTAVIRVRARSAPGAAHVRVTARSGSFFSKEELDLPIEVARSEARLTTHVPVTEAETDLLPHLAGWADGTDRSTLWLTQNPYAESLTQLRYLVRYPFG